MKAICKLKGNEWWQLSEQEDAFKSWNDVSYGPGSFVQLKKEKNIKIMAADIKPI